MKIKMKTKRARIELVPLLDMIFLVLVSFVYTFMYMTVDKGIPVSLPFAKTAVRNEGKYVVVSLAIPDKIFVNKIEVSQGEFIPYLISIYNEAPEKKILLKADKVMPYDRVVRTLDSIRSAGIEKVSLKTTQEP